MTMTQPALRRYTPREYLALEAEADHKSEYVDGQIIAITHGNGYPGANPIHNRIVANLTRAIGNRLGADCAVFTSDQRVTPNRGRSYRYPDLSVVCGTPLFVTEDGTPVPEEEATATANLTNPILIVEVFSPSTQDQDQGDKRDEYTQMASLHCYLIVHPRQPRIDRHARSEAEGWSLENAIGLDAVIEIPALGIPLLLAEVYDKVPLETEGPGHPPRVG